MIISLPVQTAEWSRRADSLPYRDPYEALILASIVEKEAGKPSERREIAGVYVRRLRQGMRLESDPTVIYGLKEFNGNLTKKDLRTDHPYNTYTRSGLPVGPIANPGEASLVAALYPAKVSYLYFVAKGDGSLPEAVFAGMNITAARWANQTPKLSFWATYLIRCGPSRFVFV